MAVDKCGNGSKRLFFRPQSLTLTLLFLLTAIRVQTTEDLEAMVEELEEEDEDAPMVRNLDETASIGVCIHS